MAVPAESINPAAPLVSVIIPTYNRVHHLPRAMTSALTQTYRNLELIVVDDASTDETPALLDSITDPRLRHLRHETNRGAPAARNTGMAAATGEWVAFLDSDDEWLPEKLSIQLAALHREKAGFCCCQATTKKPTGESFVAPQQPYRGGSMLKYLICDGGGMQSSGLVVHRDLIEPFDGTQFPHDDWDWVVRVYPKAASHVFVPQPLYHFHTDAPQRACASGGVPLIERGRPFLQKHAAEIAANPCVMRHLIWWYANNARISGNPALARRILLENRVFPSLSQKPKAFKLWLQCLSGDTR